MARTISQIQAEMDAKQATISELSGLNSPSQSAIYTLWKYVTSYAIFVMESLWDIFKSELETIAANAPVGTVQWVRSQVLKFQYDAVNPQIVQMVNFVPGYSPVDTTKQIITRCSVKTLPNKAVSVKVAKSDPPTALAALELSSLTGYLNTIGFAGVQYSILSVSPDELYLDADVYYDGQYAAVIQANVEAAIEAYLSSIPFDGIVQVSSMEDAIQSVAGVKDVVINDMAMRTYITPFANKIYMVQSNALLTRNALIYAGYVIPETTTGQTLTDKLTYVIS